MESNRSGEISLVLYDAYEFPSPPVKRTCSVHPDNSVLTLRQMVFEKFKYKSDTFEFQFKNKKIMDEEKSFSFYEIRDKSVINLVKKAKQTKTSNLITGNNNQEINTFHEFTAEFQRISSFTPPSAQEKEERVDINLDKLNQISSNPRISQGNSRILIRCGALIDGISKESKKDAIIVIEKDKIVEVGSKDLVKDKEYVEFIDLSNYTVLPGLIDTHTHPLIQLGDYQFQHLKNSSAYKSLYGMKICQQMLYCGWTTIRIAGDADVFYAHLDIKKAIEEGLYEGPRIVAAGHYISITGGGGDINYIAPEQSLHFHADGKIVNGVEEMRKAVREEIKFGSDWIKLLVTGAFMSAKDDPNDVHMSPEEIKTAVEEALRFNKPVMAHAHAPKGILEAAKAGVRSIEHGSFIDDECISIMKKKGIYLVPTLFIGKYYEQQPSTGPLEKMISLTKSTQEHSLACIRNAVKKGIKIAVGTDYAGWAVELNAKEFSCLCEVGLTPMDAIKAGTSVAAELLKLDDKIGSIEKGKIADIIAVSGDPLLDISELERVKFVMRSGKIIRHEY